MSTQHSTTLKRHDAPEHGTAVTPSSFDTIQATPQRHTTATQLTCRDPDRCGGCTCYLATSLVPRRRSPTRIISLFVSRNTWIACSPFVPALRRAGAIQRMTLHVLDESQAFLGLLSALPKAVVAASFITWPNMVYVPTRFGTGGLE